MLLIRSERYSVIEYYVCHAGLISDKVQPG